MFVVATIIVLLVGFFILLSPPFKVIRTALGLPEELPGSRYNSTVGATEIINEEYENFYLARITFVYHAVFITLLYATIIVFSAIYLQEYIRNLVLDLSLIGTLIVVISSVMYSYVDRSFLWHGTFLSGLAIFFVIALIILLNFKPKNLLEWNIWLSGILLIIGAIWGAWLGSSFMSYRHEYVEALILSRYNPDFAEENFYWRILTSHEHAMIAIALTLTFFLGIRIARLDESKALLRFFTVKRILCLTLVGQLFMAVASYAVTFFGKIAHLIITPAAILLIFGTLLLSFMVKREDILGWGLKIGNIIIWIAVALPGAIVAMSLRRPIFFNPPFRDPVWDWAELAYNIGHWHILLTTWGIALLIIYISWPENLTERNKFVKIGGWLSLIGFMVAMVCINFYMLGNPPGKYSPNPYDNIWLKFLVEPALSTMAIGIAIIYLFYLIKIGLPMIKDMFK